VARLDGLSSRTALKRVLGGYTACPEYRAKLIEGAARIDLDGNPAGTVTAGEAAYALAPKPAKTKPTPSTPPAPAPPPSASASSIVRRGRQRGLFARCFLAICTNPLKGPAGGLHQRHQWV
jgi:ProP effector